MAITSVEHKNIDGVKTNAPVKSPQSDKKRKRRKNVIKTQIYRQPRTRSRSRLLAKVTHNTEKIRITLSDKNNDWNSRCDAMKILSKLYEESAVIPQKTNFCMTLEELKEIISPIIPVLQLQLTDGRSLIIKQVCNTIGLVAISLGGPLFDEMGTSLLDGLLKLTINSKAAMSQPAVDCLHTIFTKISPLKLLLQATIEIINKSKNPLMIRQCVKCVGAAISVWELEDLLTLIKSFEKCILSTITAADSNVRAESRKTFATLTSLSAKENQSESSIQLKSIIESIFSQLNPKIQKRLQQEYQEIRFSDETKPGLKSINSSKPWIKKTKKNSKKTKSKKPKASGFKAFLKAKRNMNKANMKNHQKNPMVQ